MGNDKIKQWHPAFCGAMRLLLDPYKNDLTMENEYNLNTKPLEIDFLVVKKNADFVFSGLTIADFFRGHNLMEYKSPSDGINVDDLHKLLGYGNLYKSYGEHVDEISADDVTLSVVQDAVPKKIFNLLDKRIEKHADGIYYINGYDFPIQIVVTKELPADGYEWLKALTEDLDAALARRIVNQQLWETAKYRKEYMDSVMQISVKANTETFYRLKGEFEMCDALRELMAPEIEAELNEARKQATAKGLAEGRAEGREIAFGELNLTSEQAEELIRQIKANPDKKLTLV